ncbi:adenylate kinase 7-like [Schistocerca cancellata]|uniref:adenylate kinase 7-like n=1 Tax=Schistocerca cancellata TaxID=274614 RepID=UPI002118F9D3|nr:adenylate kinase 7-like [Schistocerca cancellata]
MLAWKAEQERKQKEEEDLERRKEAERIAHETHMQKMEEWVRLMDAMKQEEEEMLAIQSLPLRHYLMKYVFPTLTKGLMQVAQIRPSDPIDYLAEYLFRENPEGKMLEPHYHPAAEELFSSIKKFQSIARKSGEGGQSTDTES